MSNSSLVNYIKISPNSNNPRNSAIKKITIHHCAGNVSVETLGNIFAPSSRQASANYGIGSDGRVGMYVEEKNRAWTSGNAANDHQAVTIEVANDGGAPNWHVSDKALAKLIDLCVDICKRNGIESLNYTGDVNGNLTRHNMFSATTCPGLYLQGKFPYIASEVNKRLKGESVTVGTLSGTNVARLENMLVRYTYGKTGTNKWGFEVGIDRNGIALTDPIWGEGNMTVPAGGYVLSGHGTNGSWLYGNVKRGYTVSISGNAISIRKTAPKTITVNSKVRLNRGAKTYNGGSLASFVYDRDHIVSQLSGDRAVITYNGVVVAAVNVNDLTLV